MFPLCYGFVFVINVFVAMVYTTVIVANNNIARAGGHVNVCSFRHSGSLLGFLNLVGKREKMEGILSDNTVLHRRCIDV